MGTYSYIRTQACAGKQIILPITYGIRYMTINCSIIGDQSGNVIVLWKEEVSLLSNGKMPWFNGLLELHQGGEANTLFYPKRVIWVSGSNALLFLMHLFCKNERRDYKATSCLQNRKFGVCCSSRYGADGNSFKAVCNSNWVHSRTL